MSNRPKKSIASQLNNARIAINNALEDPAILALLEAYAYTAEKLRAGKVLYEAAMTAVDAQQTAAGAQREATAAMKAAYKQARAAYQSLAKVLRAVYLKQPEMVVSLGLDNPMPRDVAGFLGAAYILFDNALASRSVAAADVGYTVERVAAERGKIALLDEANQDQEAAKGAAQIATQAQDTAIAAMDDWVTQYVKIARVALQSSPQSLEKLGIVVKRK